MNYRCEHIGLAADDPRTLRVWYEQTLDAVMVLELANEPPAYLMKLSGGLLVEIYQADFSLKETGDNKLRGWRHLALQVDDLYTAKADLEARGVAFGEKEKPAGGGGRVLFFHDPEGNLFHLVERTSDFLIN